MKKEMVCSTHLLFLLYGAPEMLFIWTLPALPSMLFFR